MILAFTNNRHPPLPRRIYILVPLSAIIFQEETMENKPTRKSNWLVRVSLPISIFGLLISPLTFLLLGVYAGKAGRLAYVIRDIVDSDGFLSFWDNFYYPLWGPFGTPAGVIFGEAISLFCVATGIYGLVMGIRQRRWMMILASIFGILFGLLGIPAHILVFFFYA